MEVVFSPRAPRFVLRVSWWAAPLCVLLHVTRHTRARTRTRAHMLHADARVHVCMCVQCINNCRLCKCCGVMMASCSAGPIHVLRWPAGSCLRVATSCPRVWCARHLEPRAHGAHVLTGLRAACASGSHAPCTRTRVRAATHACSLTHVASSFACSGSQSRDDDERDETAAIAAAVSGANELVPPSCALGTPPPSPPSPPPPPPPPTR